MAILSTIGKSIYKAATTKAGAAMIIGGAATAGFAGQVAPAARDAAMDVAFGDPNADTAFLGRKLTPGSVIDANLPGGRSGTAAIAATGGGAVGGGLLGAAVGGMLGKRIKNDYAWRNCRSSYRNGIRGNCFCSVGQLHT